MRVDNPYGALSVHSLPSASLSASSGQTVPLSRRDSNVSGATAPTPQPAKSPASIASTQQSYRTAPSRARSSATRPPSLMSNVALERYRKRAVGVNNTIVILMPLIQEALPSLQAPLMERRQFLDEAAAHLKLTDTEALNLHELVLAVASAIFGELTRAPPGTPRFETPTLAIEHHVDRLGVLRFYVEKNI